MLAHGPRYESKVLVNFMQLLFVHLIGISSVSSKRKKETSRKKNRCYTFPKPYSTSYKVIEILKDLPHTSTKNMMILVDLLVKSNGKIVYVDKTSLRLVNASKIISILRLFASEANASNTGADCSCLCCTCSICLTCKYV